MAEESIFHRIVQTEDAHTQLLFNLALRDEHFRKSFLSFLISGSDSSLIDKRHIFVQKRLANRGRADLLVETSSISVIVEVKTERGRGRTAKQLLNGPEDDPDSYISYLTEKVRHKSYGLLVFLTPPDWKYQADVENEIKKFDLKARTKGVVVKQLTWQEFLKCHVDAEENSGFSLWREFQNLLRVRFDPIRLNEEELRSMIDGKMTLLSAVRFNKLISDIRLRAKKAGLPVTELSADTEEFGFYFKSNKEWVMFFGCAPTYWEHNPPALCCLAFGPIQKAFEAAVQEILGHAVVENGEWVGAGFKNEDLGLGVEHIFQKLEKIWLKASGISKKRSQIKKRPPAAAKK